MLTRLQEVAVFVAMLLVSVMLGAGMAVLELRWAL